MVKKKGRSNKNVEKKVKKVERTDIKIKLCKCGHESDVHYGGTLSNCNTQGCPCLEMK